MDSVSQIPCGVQRTSVIALVERRGHEQWARDLLDELDVETVQGSVDLEEIVNSLTVGAAEEIVSIVSFDQGEVVESDWQAAMKTLRDQSNRLGLSVTDRQHIWWLFPVYRDQPDELERILQKVIDERHD